MRVIIFANGEVNPQKVDLDIEEDDLVIAANGGSRHCLDLGITPHILLGDLDSIDQTIQDNWQDEGVKIINFPEDKDQTDLELALLHAQEQDPVEILVYGAFGGRLDMTLANLTLLAHPQLISPTIFVCETEKVFLLHPGETLSLAGNPGDTVSLIPIHSGLNNVTTDGLKYSLKNEALEFGYTRGISNSLIEKKAQIKLDSGLLIVVQSH